MICVGFLDAQLVGLATALVNVEILHGDLAILVALGGVGVFAKQSPHVAVDLRDLGIFRIFGERDDDAHRPGKIVEVGECFRRERKTVAGA